MWRQPGPREQRTGPVTVTEAWCCTNVSRIENLPGASSLIRAHGGWRNKELLTVALENRGNEAGEKGRD